MKPSLFILLGVGLLGYSLVNNLASGVADAVTPLPADPVADADLYSVFSRTDDKVAAARHAREFGSICEQVAHSIKFDSEQSAPQFTTAAKMHDAASMTRYYRVDGKSFKSAYPSLEEELRKVMSDRLGTDSGKVTNEQRADWIKCFSDLAAEAEYTALRLERSQ